MRTVLFLSTLFVGAQSFGIHSVSQSRVSTQLFLNLPDDTLTEDQKKTADIQAKWKEIRLMDRETAQKELDGEWLEAYQRFFEKYDNDMERMAEIAKKLEKMIEPPRIQKKNKGEKKRDKYAKVLAREAARAAAQR